MPMLTLPPPPLHTALLEVCFDIREATYCQFASRAAFTFISRYEFDAADASDTQPLRFTYRYADV